MSIEMTLRVMDDSDIRDHRLYLLLLVMSDSAPDSEPVFFSLERLAARTRMTPRQIENAIKLGRRTGRLQVVSSYPDGVALRLFPNHFDRSEA